MESIPVRGGLVDIQLTQADSHGDCLSIPLFNCTPSAHLIKLPIKRIKQQQTNNTNTWPSLEKWTKSIEALVGELVI